MSHTCHAPNCPVEVPPKMFMCKPHWMALRPSLRDAIWKTYRPGQEITKDPSPEYLTAARKAIDYLTAKLSGVATAALVCLALMSPVRADHELCMPRAAMIKNHASVFSETPRVVGVSSSGLTVEILAAPSGEWTMITTTAKGISCWLMSGDGLEVLTQGQDS